MPQKRIAKAETRANLLAGSAIRLPTIRRLVLHFCIDTAVSRISIYRDSVIAFADLEPPLAARLRKRRTRKVKRTISGECVRSKFAYARMCSYGHMKPRQN